MLELLLLLLWTGCCLNSFYAASIQSPFKPLKSSLQVGKLQMSPIGAGTWSWGNKFLWGYKTEDDIALQDTFDYLTSHGVNWFDTADSYGTGSLTARSEVLLGQFSQPPRKGQSSSSISFCTKLAPFPWLWGQQAMQKKILASQQRLGRPIDMVQFHWPPLPWQEDPFITALVRGVREGHARQLGLSNFGPKSIRRVSAKVEALGEVVYSNQVQFSLLSRQPLMNGLAETCASKGIRLIGYSPLALGLLTDRYSMDRLPSGPRGVLFREYLPVLRPLLDELRSIAKQRRKSVSQVVLNWTLAKGIMPLVGMRSVEQAKENLGALGWSLTEAEVEAIDSVAVKLPKSLVQNFNQSD
eukprot:gene3459-3789_t